MDPVDRPPGTAALPKRLVWLGDSLEVLKSFPELLQRDIGFALYQAQAGGKSVHAKPLTGIGPGVLEVVADYGGNTYRAVHTVKLTGRIYVLHVFQKKSKSGIATPRSEINRVRVRLKRAIELHQMLED